MPNLTPTEWKVASVLVAAGNRFTPSEVLRREARIKSDNSLKATICHMRKKGLNIESAYGAGYRLWFRDVTARSSDGIRGRFPLRKSRAAHEQRCRDRQLVAGTERGAEA